MLINCLGQMGVVLMLELGQCYRVPPSPNCYQVTPVHYGSAADVNKKDTKDEESLKTRYYLRVQSSGMEKCADAADCYPLLLR